MAAGKVCLARERHAQPVVRLRRPRAHLHGALERVQRTRIVVRVQVGEAEDHQRLGITRAACDGGLELQE